VAVGLARLELDTLAATGPAAALRWVSRGRGVQEFGARYAELFLLGEPLRAELAMEQHLEDTLYTRTRWGARLQFVLSGQEKLEAGHDQERVVQGQGELAQAARGTTFSGLERDARDDRVGPRHGTRARLTGSQTFKREELRPSGERKSQASAVEAAYEWHRPLGGAGARTGLAVELAGAGRFSTQRV